jgi:hypothetical protein
MKNKFISILFMLIFASVIFYSGCDDTVTGNDIDNKIIPDHNVSYSEHIYPVLNAKCTNSGCHDDITMAAGLSLTNYSSTTADYSVVAPGFPDLSKLVWAIEGNGATLMPPLGYPALTQNQIDGIKTWIEEGAKNN